MSRVWATILALTLSGPTQLACNKVDEVETQYPTIIIISDIAIEEPDCGDCGRRLTEAFETATGVIGAIYHPDSQEITVSYDPNQTNPGVLVELARTMGIHASEGVGGGVSEPQIEFPPEMDVQVISEAGEMVELSEHLADGKVTVFDFRAVWCGPCREVDLQLKELAIGGTVFALRILDVSDWDSPVAQHYLAGLDGLPYLIIVGPDGDERAEIMGLDAEAMRTAIEGEVSAQEPEENPGSAPEPPPAERSGDSAAPQPGESSRVDPEATSPSSE